MTSTNKFLKGYTIDVCKVPRYTQFKAIFKIPVDEPLFQAIMKSEDPVFKPETKKILSNLFPHINNGLLTVRHHQNYNVGRFCANNSISPICLSRHIKHTLFSYLNWIDIDMVKGHPSIIFNLAKNNNLYLPTFDEYLKNPETIFDMLSDYYSDPCGVALTHDHIKGIFNVMIYGGGFSTWENDLLEKEGIAINQRAEIHPFIVAFKNEVKTITRIIYDANPDFITHIKGDLTDQHKIQCRLMSYYCGCLENEIVYTTATYLIKNGLMEAKRFLPEYDGLCLPTPEKEFDANQVIFEINNKILKETGLAVKMKFKGYQAKHIHQEVINARVEETTVDAPVGLFFDEMKTKFELDHCKIVNKSFFIIDMPDNIIIQSRSQMATSYEHLNFLKTDSKGNIHLTPNFIGEWFKCDEQNCMVDIGVYPDISKCPKNHFNAWKPFAMELVTEYVADPDAVKIFKKHILILCDNDPVIADYFIKWLAQMIQFPAVKSICPVLISKEGAGKGSLIQLIEKMIGSSKTFQTSNPNRDVWGDFNGTMASAFFVILNELSKKDTIESEGKIKEFVTDPTMWINNKNITQYKINSFHRFIITTNNHDPIKTTADDRRKLIIRSSDELIGNKEYFNDLYALINDENAVKSFYEYLKTIPDMGCFGNLPLPITEFQENVKASYVACEVQWLENFVATREVDEVRLSGKDCLDLFKDWLIGNGMSDYNTNSVKFGLKLSNMKMNGLTKNHTKTGRMYLFDIPVLKKTMGF